MSYDIEHTIIFARTVPPVVVYGNTVIGETHKSISITDRGSDFTIFVREEKSDLDPKRVTVVRIDEEMLAAMVASDIDRSYPRLPVGQAMIAYDKEAARNLALETAAKIAERPRVQDAMNGDVSVSADAKEIAAEIRALKRLP